MVCPQATQRPLRCLLRKAPRRVHVVKWRSRLPTKLIATLAHRPLPPQRAGATLTRFPKRHRPLATAGVGPFSCGRLGEACRECSDLSDRCFSHSRLRRVLRRVPQDVRIVEWRAWFEVRGERRLVSEASGPRAHRRLRCCPHRDVFTSRHREAAHAERADVSRHAAAHWSRRSCSSARRSWLISGAAVRAWTGAHPTHVLRFSRSTTGAGRPAPAR